MSPVVPPERFRGGDNSIVGGFVASNQGAIRNSSANYLTEPPSSPANATINVIGGAFSSVGGLVGSNLVGATITTSYADVNVTVTGGNSAFVGGLLPTNRETLRTRGGMPPFAPAPLVWLGGLVGSNLLGATISNSFATGNVAGGNSAFAGGLVGQNAGAIEGTTLPGLHPVPRTPS